jgi:hypothetical protein
MFMCNTAVRDFCEKNATPILATIAGVAIGLQLASSKGKTKSLPDVNNLGYSCDGCLVVWVNVNGRTNCPARARSSRHTHLSTHQFVIWVNHYGQQQFEINRSDLSSIWAGIPKYERNDPIYTKINNSGTLEWIERAKSLVFHPTKCIWYRFWLVWWVMKVPYERIVCALCVSELLTRYKQRRHPPHHHYNNQQNTT